MNNFTKINGELVTQPKVLRSNAGYYVGREFLDKEFEMIMPYDRFTDYFKDKSHAEDVLSLYTDKSPYELSIIGLMVTVGVSEVEAIAFMNS